MKNAVRIGLFAVLVWCLTAGPAEAWGPRTNLALVGTALRLVSHEGLVPLSKLEKDLLNGVTVSSHDMETLFPGSETDPISAIEAEIYLLQAARGDKIDPYFAYRLGALGRLVARTTAPMARKPALYRDLYYADVDDQIASVALKPARRTTVESKEYFTRVLAAVGIRDDIYEKDYSSGVGFAGTAKASLSEDASRSVTAIVDVWYTILMGDVLHLNLPESGMRDYIVGALRYYIMYDKEGYIDGTYERLIGLTHATPDLHKRIGDMFYDAQKYERAITEYKAVLAIEPGEKEVAGKIAAYYVQEGDKALQDNKLEDARDAYAAALAADPLHPDAEGKRLHANQLIAEREERLQAAKLALSTAQELRQKADQAVLETRFVEAMTFLHDAEALYAEVPAEFPPEYKMADTALKETGFRLRELKEKMVTDAQSLSGSGFTIGVQNLAAGAQPQMDEAALRSLIRGAYETEAKKLRQDLGQAFDIR